MKNTTKSRSFLNGFLIFAFFNLLFTSYAIGQSGKSSTMILTDSVQSDQIEKDGFLKKIIEPMRFRENRIKKEKERIYDLIRNLADSGDLSIDSLAVNLIIEDLPRVSNDSSQSWEEIQKIQDELIGLIDTLGFESANSKVILKKLVQLKAVQIKCDPPMIPSEGKAINDSTFLCLTAKAKVFGWHDGNLDSKVIDGYNFNYLTDIIYNGYELGPNGNNKNEKLHETLFRDNSFSLLIEKNKVKLSLSIFSKSATDISTFLSNKKAQETFISNFKGMQEVAPIVGINIYFENLPINDRQSFSAFVYDVKRSFETEDEGFLITLSLPPISKDREKVKAYDLESLGPLVDYFLIQTDKVKLLTDESKDSPSSYFKIEERLFQSIQSSLDFYSNGKIPISKIVITVTYSGIKWIGKSQNQRLWFEDPNSLYRKYNYALAQNLGGVAIWGLGLDNEESLFWDVLGAALVQVDTLIVSTKPSGSGTEKKITFWEKIVKNSTSVIALMFIIGLVLFVFMNYSNKKI